MSKELDAQNQHIGRISKKTELLDDSIAGNQQRLATISKRG